MQVAEARRYSRRIGFSRCDSVKGTPGRSSASSSPTRISWAGLAIDQRRQTPIASIRWSRRRGEDLAHGRVVERTHHLAGGADPFGDLEGQGARNIGFRERPAIVVGVEAAAFAQEQDVAMPGRGQERRPRRRPGEDGIDGARGRMDERLDPAEEAPRIGLQVGGGKRDRRNDAADRVVRRGRRLEEPQLGAVGNDEVGERTADIASQSQHRSPHARLSPPRSRAHWAQATGIWQGASAASPALDRHGRACPGHPRLVVLFRACAPCRDQLSGWHPYCAKDKMWVAWTSPTMTVERMGECSRMLIAA